MGQKQFQECCAGGKGLQVKWFNKCSLSWSQESHSQDLSTWEWEGIITISGCMSSTPLFHVLSNFKKRPMTLGFRVLQRGPTTITIKGYHVFYYHDHYEWRTISLESFYDHVICGHVGSMYLSFQDGSYYGQDHKHTCKGWNYQRRHGSSSMCHHPRSPVTSPLRPSV